MSADKLGRSSTAEPPSQSVHYTLFTRVVSPHNSCGAVLDVSSARYFSTGASFLRSDAKSSAGTV